MRYAAFLAISLALVPSCQQDEQRTDSKPATRPVNARPSTWDGARPSGDGQYDQRVTEAKRQGRWPPSKARTYRVFVFQDQRWKVLGTVNSSDSADALHQAIRFILEDYYDQPVAVLPVDQQLPPVDPKTAY